LDSPVVEVCANAALCVVVAATGWKLNVLRFPKMRTSDIVGVGSVADVGIDARN
jgi:hypothetical protein